MNINNFKMAAILVYFRQQLERLPNRRQVETNKNNAAGSSANASGGESQTSSTNSAKSNSPFLLARLVSTNL